MNLRMSDINYDGRYTPPVIAPSMPASIRQLLDLPDSPTPAPRSRRRIGAQNPRLPAGPPPPRSWLEPFKSSNGDALLSGNSSRRCRSCIDRLPGLSRIPPPRSLTATCLRRMSQNWSFYRGYDRYYLAMLPTEVRMILLSYLALYGPEEGVGYEGLKAILRPRDDMLEAFAGNDDFQRLDLSGSIGRSISFKQLSDLITHVEDTGQEESWDAALTIPPALYAPLHSLKILSLANPPPGIKWSKLLSFASCVPTLTHLSLANWPIPTLTPNSNTTTVSHSPSFPQIQYGATNFYSLSLDGDYSDAASVLMRLSNALYSLEWLHLDGCNVWASALRWDTPEAPGIDWKKSWGKVRVIGLRSGVLLSEDASERDVIRYKSVIMHALSVEDYIRKQRGWIVVEHDQWDKYDTLCDLNRNSVFRDLERMFQKAKLGRKGV
jgi:hypothetical protein